MRSEKGQSVLKLFPSGVRQEFAPFLQYAEEIEEIRIRAGGPVCVYIKGKEYYVNSKNGLCNDREGAYVTDYVEVEKIFSHLCEDSPYAFREELKQGFLTVRGGHRIGVAGQVILEGDKVIGMKNIRFLNIRIAHEVIGVAEPVIPYLFKEGQFLNTMIISSPREGKTTLLRDIIRLLSDGNQIHAGVNVAVVDERSEIAGCYMGIPQNRIGIRTDVLDNCPKSSGMMMLIRSMAPKVIAIDELGGSEDVTALKKVLHCGCKVIVTMHAATIDEVKKKREMQELLEDSVFERFIVLGRKGTDRITEIYGQEGEMICLRRLEASFS